MAIKIFPNYAAVLVSSEVRFEPSETLVVEPIVEAGAPVRIAATGIFGEVKGNLSPISHSLVEFTLLGRGHLKAPRIRRAFGYISILFRVLREVARSRFCYVYVPGNVGLLAVLSCWLFRKPYGLYMRGEWRYATPLPLRGLHDAIVRKAAFVMCTTEVAAARLRHLNKHSVSEVPLSLLLSCRFPIRPAFSGAKIFTISFVGQMIREKGIFELLSAIDTLRRRGKHDVRLIMVGAGGDADEFEAEIERRGLRDWVSFQGTVKDPGRLAEVYSASDVFCLPSYSEGFPRVVYEAMYFGLPIVTTEVGQINTVIHNNYNGVFCKPRNDADLSAAIDALLVDPERRRRLGRAARETVEPLLELWEGQSHGRQVVELLKLSGYWEVVAASRGNACPS